MANKKVSLKAKISKLGILITISLLISLPLNLPYLYKIYALDFIAPLAAGIDESLIKTNDSYKQPAKILVVPIFINEVSLGFTDQTWYKGIFYYSIDRLGFSNIPFHYIVSSEGDIYSTEGGDERKILIKDLGDTNIVVGYLSANSTISGFDFKARSSLENLLLDICNRNDIKPMNISVAGLNFVKDPITRLVSINSTSLYGNWILNTNDIIKDISSKYSPIIKQYSIQVEELNLINTNVVVGQSITSSIKVKNTGNYAIYGGSDNSLILSKISKVNSVFFSNNDWLSQTQFGIMSDGQVLLPGKDLTLNFKLKAPLYIGVQSENFEILTASSQKVNATNVQIKLNVIKADKKIVQINNTETNYLKVHSVPSTVSPEVGRVESGGRYFVLDQDPNGFIKIDLNNGNTGWIAGWLTTNI